MSLLKHKGLMLSLAVLAVAVAVTFGGRLFGAVSVFHDPSEAKTYTTSGLGFLQKARETGDPTYYGRAETAFNQALAIDSQNVDALIGKGSLALSRHQFKDGLALGKQAFALDPHRAAILSLIVDGEVELGMYDDAAKSVQDMIDLRPDLSSYSRASYVRELNGDIPGAIELMQQAVESGAPTPENVGWVRVQLGNLYFNKGDIASAEQEYQHALVQFPGYRYALAGLAHVRAVQGHYSEAVDLYTQAINSVPLPEFVIALGETEQAAGQTAEADKQYGLVRVEEKLFQANGVNTDMEEALFEADHGKPDAALAQARIAYRDRPSVKAADTLAWALSQAGQQQEAQQYEKLALRLGTQDALFFYHAGMIAYRSGDHAEARARLEQALAVNPNFSMLYVKDARQILEQAAK